MTDEEHSTKKSNGPILHVIVVGFHHKKGCQVEYSFPPLVDGGSFDSNECPPGWKYLPTLALPDGSHNFEEDTVYFHLPSLTNPKQTVYGISCFRQIPVEKVTNRTADITRGTVQKSVCVLSTLPLYGHIQVKMALITHAYFQEGDFSKVSLLQDTFINLNDCLNEEMLDSTQVFVGLSPRDLILQFKHKALLMFKLMLLERKVLFFKSPVQHLCSTILSLLSLHPGMLERGLTESACVKPSRPMSPIPHFSIDVEDKDSVDAVDTLKSTRLSNPTFGSSVKNFNETEEVDVLLYDSSLLQNNKQSDPEISSVTKTNSAVQRNSGSLDQENVTEVEHPLKESQSDKNMNGSTQVDINISAPGSETEQVSASRNNLPAAGVMTSGTLNIVSSSIKGRISGAINYWSAGRDKSPSPEKVEIAEEAEGVSIPASTSLEKNIDGNGDIPKPQPNMSAIASISADECGCPLSIFTKGYLCHPYLSLPYLDLLNDVKVRGYVIGATNVLFKQKKQIADVIVEIDDLRVETQDLDLRRQLHLTTQDLRFADYIVRQVSEERYDVFLDGVGWEGGDEWIRAQFRLYLLCLLRTSLLEDGSKEHEHFNASFMSAWKTTSNYKLWESQQNSAILKVVPGHPFSGQLSVADMKLRLSHTMQNTEGGRKLNQAMTSTGRAVAHTGRAMGGAISQARGALSSWWSTLVTAQSPESDSPLEGARQLQSNQDNHSNNERNSEMGDEPSLSDSEVDNIKVKQRNLQNAKGAGGKTDSARHSCLLEFTKSPALGSSGDCDEKEGEDSVSEGGPERSHRIESKAAQMLHDQDEKGDVFR